MDMKQSYTKLVDTIKKYRYPLLIAVLGVILLWLPTAGKTDTAPQVIQQEQKSQSVASELTEILGSIAGVGRVQVLLTVSAGETAVYQTDIDDSGTAIRKETVIITDSDRNQQALVTQILPESYRGAIIVCQGADSPAVKLAVVEAVSRATGLGADQISVLKMK